MGADRFEFGKNWASYSHLIDDEKISRSQDRLAVLLGTRDLSGRCCRAASISITMCGIGPAIRASRFSRLR